MNTPLIATISIIFLALVCEFLLMVLLQAHTAHHSYWALLDSTALALMISPAMYFLMYKPLKNQELLIKNFSKEIKGPNDIIQICTGCSKVRDQNGNWLELKKYLHEQFGVELISSSCPKCQQQ